MGLRERAIRYKEAEQIFDSPLDTIPGPASFSVPLDKRKSAKVAGYAADDFSSDPAKKEKSDAPDKDDIDFSAKTDSFNQNLEDFPDEIEPVFFDEVDSFSDDTHLNQQNQKEKFLQSRPDSLYSIDDRDNRGEYASEKDMREKNIDNDLKENIKEQLAENFEEEIEEEIYFPADDQKSASSISADSAEMDEADRLAQEGLLSRNDSAQKPFLANPFFAQKLSQNDFWSKQQSKSTDSFYKNSAVSHASSANGIGETWEILDALFAVDNRGSLLDLMFLGFMNQYGLQNAALWQVKKDSLILLACQNKNVHCKDVVELTRDQMVFLSCASVFVSLKEVPGTVATLEQISQNWLFLLRPETEDMFIFTISEKPEASWEALQQQSRLFSAALDFFNQRKSSHSTDYVALASEKIQQILSRQGSVIAASLSLKNLQRVQNIYGLDKEKEIIEMVWEILHAELTGQDLLLRLVSNRFLLILNHQELSAADKVMNKIYDRIRQIPVSEEMKLIVTYQMWQSPADFQSAGELIAMFA